MSNTTPIAGYQVGEELAQSIMARFPTTAPTHLTTIPPRPAQYAAWPEWIHPPLKEHLIDSDIKQPFSHQSECAEHAYAGRDVVVATGTSSGKSLSYLMPILSTLAQSDSACAVYITPTKALGSDQLSKVTALCRAVPGLEGVHAAPYDGDTPSDARAGIRDQSRFIFTNPDMLHTGILPNHQRWARLLRHLRFMVVDECHSYRGVFGANVALTLRRLLRVCARYGSRPVVLFASATSNNPAEHASNLIGRPVVAVDNDGAPTGARTIMLWEPGFYEDIEGENGAPVRRAATTDATRMMATLITDGARTLTFVRSRRQAETVALRCQEELNSAGRFDLSKRVASYRAGYLAEDRRRLEQQLDDGTLLGVASTNALELGIDVGGLDAVVMAGYPGTVASFWQQGGRAGRRGQGSLVALVARDDPMDTYLVHHPEALLGRPIERTVFNPANPHILLGHMYCAALEAPLSDAEVQAFHAQAVMDELARMGLVRKRPKGWFAALAPGQASPHELVSLRGTGEQFAIVDCTDGRLLGTIDSARAVSDVHPGAVYLHQGESFVIEDLNFDDHVALARPELPDFTTQSRADTQIRIVSAPDKVTNPSPGLWVSNVEVEVVTQVVGYIRRAPDGTILEQVPLDMPPSQLRTRAVAYTIHPLVLQELGIDDIPGTLHAAEHAAIGMLPLLATCDRWDIGGVSTEEHPDTLLPTVFVYDGHPGGAGFADEGFDRFPQWIESTLNAVESCGCEEGCPSCVQSPKCGNGNNPLNKAGAITLLGALVAMTATGYNQDADTQSG